MQLFKLQKYYRVTFSYNVHVCIFTVEKKLCVYLGEESQEYLLWYLWKQARKSSHAETRSEQVTD